MQSFVVALTALSAFTWAQTQIQEVFTVDETCNNVNDLQGLFGQVIGLLENAFTAAVFLQEMTEYPPEGRAYNWMRNAHQNLGTTYWQENGQNNWSDNDLKILRNIATGYLTIRDALTPGALGAVSPTRTRLYCNSSPFRLADSPNDINPSWPRDTEMMTWLETPYAFYDPRFRNSTNGVATMFTGEKEPQLCYVNVEEDSADDAMTIEKPDEMSWGLISAIVLCEPFFDEDNLDTPEALKDAAENPTDEQQYALDFYSSQAGIFIHELTHLVLDTRDYKLEYQPADGSGAEQLSLDNAATVSLFANHPERFSGAEGDRIWQIPNAYKLFAESCYISNGKFDTPYRSNAEDKRAFKRGDNGTEIAGSAAYPETGRYRKELGPQTRYWG